MRGTGGGGARREAGGRLYRPGEDRRLPWLDPEAEEDDSADPALDPSRILGLALGALALLAAFGGAAWWLIGARGEEAVVADGSIIEAPPGPYKVRPADSGGSEVAGTGNVSFAIAEGQAREGRIAGAGGGSQGAVGVQIGAYPSEEEARAGWQALHQRIPALSGRPHRILAGEADAGAVFLLQAVTASEADAQALCAAIREDGGDCQVKR